jgi:hypothetical protein
MAALYGEFFSFPFLVFSREPDLYVIATLVTFARGTWRARPRRFQAR